MELVQALRAYRDLLGCENVLVDEATICAAQTATYATNQQVCAIIRPGERSQVQECMRIANLYKTPIYPVSKGKNWGIYPLSLNYSIDEFSTTRARRLWKIITTDQKGARSKQYTCSW